MVIRIEVKVDGRVVRVEEEDVDVPQGNYTNKIWNLLSRGQDMLKKLTVADLIY